MRHLRHFAISRSPRYRRCLAGTVCAVLLTASSLAGQGAFGTPARAADDPASRPTRLSPKTTDPDAPRRPSIRVEKLEDPGTDAVGLLSRSNGGFGADMWRGSDRQEITAYLGTMPVTAALPERASLIRRLLLTTAVPPAGEGTLSDLVSIRLDRLYAMGRLGDLAGLARLARNDKPNSIRIEAEVAGLLLDRRTEEACALVQRYIAVKPGRFLNRALLVCTRLTGKAEDVERLVAILREDDAKFDPALVALAGDAPDKVDGETLGKIDPLKLALAIGVKAPVPAGWAKTDAPALLRAIALFAEVPVEARLRAAENAFAAGAIGEKSMGDIYLAATGKSAEDPGAIDFRDYGPMARARYYSAAAAAGGARRVDILGRWWVMARGAGDFALSARLSAPLLDGISPTNAMKDQAPLAARVLFFAGRADDATAWYRVIAKAPFKDIEQEDDLALIAWIAGANDHGWTTARLRRWIVRRTEGPGGRALAGAVFAVADALGLPADSRALWLPAVDANARLSAAGTRWYAIQRAAENRELGEALVRLQVTLGEVPLVKAAPNDLRQTVRVLRTLKLENEARRLALQTLIARGL